MWVPGRRPGGFLNQVQLELSQPPEGIAIERVLPDAGGVAIVLSTEAGKVKPGLKGNLIVGVFTERTFPGRDGKQGNKRRIPLGTLPAIPVEVVASQTSIDLDPTSPAE